MFGELTRTRAEGCLTDLRMDAFLTGELSAEEQRAVEAHRAVCERCDGRLRELESASTDYLASAAALALSRDLHVRASGRARRRWLMGATAGMALAAATTLALVTPADETRTKGGDRIGFYVRHNGRVRLGQNNESVRPGDLLRFTYASERPAHLIILGLDAAGQASLYFTSDQVAPGKDLPLPNSVELDATLGVERIYGLFCEHAQDAEELTRKLSTETSAWSAPDGCILDVLQIRKELGD